MRGTHEVSFIFQIDVTLMMSKLQIMKVCRNFFLIYSFKVTSRPPCFQFASTLHPHKVTLCGGGTTSHNTSKVTCCGRDVSFMFRIDVTLMMISKLQMMKICRKFSLYTVSKLPRIYLTPTLCPHEVTLCGGGDNST